MQNFIYEYYNYYFIILIWFEDTELKPSMNVFKWSGVE